MKSQHIKPVPFFSRRSMVVAAHGDDLYFFGGVGAKGTESILDVSADLWCFSTKDFSWAEIPIHGHWPSPRRCVGFVAHDDKLLLWGGSGVEMDERNITRHIFLNDMWVFDPQSIQWKIIYLRK